MVTSISELLLSEKIGDKAASCEKHGNYTSSGMRFLTGKGREVWTRCPSCRTDAEDAEKAEVVAAAAAADTARIAAMISQTAIPPRFIGRSFSNYNASTPEQTKALSTCKGYAESFDRHATSGSSLIFCGPPGTGKSHLAAAILQAILPSHVGAYMTFSSLIRLVRDTWRRDSEKSETQILSELSDIALLVVDEIGVQYGTEAEHNLFFEIMDLRYRNRRPSILMTNQNPEGLKGFVGDRVYDRLRETSRLVMFDWPSYRAQARKEFE